LGGTAPRTIVIGCEVENIDEGMGLSGPVAAAVPGAVAAINDVIADLSARTTAPTRSSAG
jgi:hydrogenase maturation protease